MHGIARHGKVRVLRAQRAAGEPRRGLGVRLIRLMKPGFTNQDVTEVFRPIRNAANISPVICMLLSHSALPLQTPQRVSILFAFHVYDLPGKECRSALIPLRGTIILCLLYYSAPT